MLCPVCQETLLMTDRQGVEIDYCPKCRGIWLDRGELEKLIERSVADTDAAPQRRGHHPDDHDDDHRNGSHYQGKYKRRESWLGRILDFE